MKGMYTKVYDLRRSEMLVAILFALLAVAVYSFWGAHLIHSQANAGLPDHLTTRGK